MRRITVIGNLTADAEVKDVSNRKVINFAVATNENYKDNDGQKMEKAFYYNCAMWREHNVKVAEYMTKGTKVFIEGKPEVEIYKTKDGEVKGDIKIIVTNLELIGGGSGHKVPYPKIEGDDEIQQQGGKHKDLPF